MFTNGKFDTIKSDIWSIGITLFCISEKRFPYFNGTENYIKEQITNGRLLIGSKVSQKLRNIVKKCTEFKPEARPSIEDLMLDDYFSSDRRKSNFLNYFSNDYCFDDIYDSNDYSSSC